jgi:hypothetical protein
LEYLFRDENDYQRIVSEITRKDAFGRGRILANNVCSFIKQILLNKYELENLNEDKLEYIRLAIETRAEFSIGYYYSESEKDGKYTIDNIIFDHISLVYEARYENCLPILVNDNQKKNINYYS